MAYNARMTIAVRESSEPPAIREAASSLYRTDFYSWTRQQSRALRRREVASIDWDNVIEEIESLGSEQEHKWTGHAALAIEHMFKILHWPDPPAATATHWRDEIEDRRDDMALTIKRNPALQGRYDEILEDAWRIGRGYAVKKLTRATVAVEGEARRKSARGEWQARIPQQCPWPLREILGYDPARPKSARARHHRRKVGPQPDPEVWPAPVAKRLAEIIRRASREPASRPRPRPRPAGRWSR